MRFSKNLFMEISKIFKKDLQLIYKKMIIMSRQIRRRKTE